jgi:type I site-specific restriction-modification system R (restriction) subunit
VNTCRVFLDHQAPHSQNSPVHRKFSESVVEDAALEWLEGLGHTVLHGPDIAAGEPGAERIDPKYRNVILERRLRQSLVRLNPALPPDKQEKAAQLVLEQAEVLSAQWAVA